MAQRHIVLTGAWHEPVWINPQWISRVVEGASGSMLFFDGLAACGTQDRWREPMSVRERPAEIARQIHDSRIS